MSYYVQVKQLTSLGAHLALGEWLNQSGAEQAEYNAGGWSDQSYYVVRPHLKFEQESDAIAYALAHGTIVTTTVPQHREDSHTLEE